MRHSTPIPGPIFSEPVFNEGKFLPDPNGFLIPHPSDDATYAQIEQLLYTQTVGIPPSRPTPDGLYCLGDVYGTKGPTVVDQIVKAGRIVFHMVGDTGAATAGTYSSELRACDKMVTDFRTKDPAMRPSFFFHLGDVVYNFGEGKYYYDEFYEPFRNYPRPIVALAGNHDSFVLPDTPEGQTPLDVFQENFCAEKPAVTADAYSLHRTAMTQPGVYFAFDAPFVRVIGLFSNALEDPGVVSSQGGKWANVADMQLDFLKAQLQRAVAERYAGALLLAVHHPPFVYQPPAGPTTGHQSSLDMLREIDAVCAGVGLYPHAVLSGHTHNYQRFTRKVSLADRQLEVPFIICGNGGHAVSAMVDASQARPVKGADVSYIDVNPGVTSGSLTIDGFDDTNFGYLLVTVDGSCLKIAYKNTASSAAADGVTVDLRRQVLVQA